MAFGIGKIVGGGILGATGALIWVGAAEPRVSPLAAVGGAGVCVWGLVDFRRARTSIRSRSNPMRLARGAVAALVESRLPATAQDGIAHSIASRLVSDASFAGVFVDASTPDEVVRLALRATENVLDTRPEIIAALIEENSPKPKDLSAVPDIAVDRESGTELLQALEDATGLLEKDLCILAPDVARRMPKEVRLAAAQCVDLIWQGTMEVGTSTFRLRSGGLAAFKDATSRYDSVEHTVMALAVARRSKG